MYACTSMCIWLYLFCFAREFCPVWAEDKQRKKKSHFKKDIKKL